MIGSTVTLELWTCSIVASPLAAILANLSRGRRQSGIKEPADRPPWNLQQTLPQQIEIVFHR